MAQPATAGIVVGLIFVALFAAFFGYKLYRWLYWRRLQKRQAQSELPLQSDGINTEPSNNVHQRTYSMPGTASPRTTVVGSLYGDMYLRDSWKGSMSKASPASTPYLGALSYANSDVGLQRPRRTSSSGLMSNEYTQEGSAPGSPTSATGDGIPFPDPADGRHSRALSSASSTMALKRSYTPSMHRPASSYAGSAFRGSTGNLLAGAIPPRRDSYLPHLPGNREKVQIIPPQPLGFGLGGMAQAVDEKTLTFSKTSGIGDLDDEFSRSLLLQTRQGDEQAASAAVAAGLLSSEQALHLRGAGSAVGEEDLNRYLAQGPSRSMTPQINAAIHDHIYPNSQTPSAGEETPEGNSRSRSPAPNHWEGSTSSQSDVGPSVSQRGAVPPSLPPTSLNQSVKRAMDTQSPLEYISGHGDGKDVPFQPPFTNNGEGDTSFSTNIGDSPILKAFQNPAVTKSTTNKEQ